MTLESIGTHALAQSRLLDAEFVQRAVAAGLRAGIAAVLQEIKDQLLKRSKINSHIIGGWLPSCLRAGDLLDDRAESRVEVLHGGRRLQFYTPC